MTPQAETIRQALLDRGEQVRNDHVAFRTFNIGPMRLEKLEPFILELGYQRYEPYHFPAKKLDAYGYIPPSNDLPRIFISELRVQELSGTSQTIIQGLVDQVDEAQINDASIFWRGPLWQVPSYSDYQTLAEESEYAAWLSIIGLRANHFTIDINALSQITEVSEMNSLIESLGYSINDSGGRVKGSPEVLLEQSSTMASKQAMTFAGGEQHEVTTCYYEFAKRYLDHDGQLYQGFVAASADKIFESTNMKTTG
ncbi:hypothetical protein MED297_14175 [Reinekea sp. MED297]|uniref:2-oxoadipate dioxygenase/decarboxylase n=2 Tax=Reinekea TaxID=230494 RepID=A4BGM1_9GAMM|nr:hypothetical protein MED297_14175 [Reinekea sp. MED297] [Reinekea blandensis MED297]